MIILILPSYQPTSTIKLIPNLQEQEEKNMENSGICSLQNEEENVVTDER